MIDAFSLWAISAAFLLVACGQNEPPAKGEAGPPGPAGWPGPAALLARLVRPPTPDGRSGSLRGPAVKRPVARVAKRMSKFSMPTRSIPEVRSALLTNAM